MTHKEQDVCLREYSWNAVNTFMVETETFRKGLNKTLQSIQTGIGAVILVILIPCIMMILWFGKMNERVDRCVADIAELKGQFHSHEIKDDKAYERTLR